MEGDEWMKKMWRQQQLNHNISEKWLGGRNNDDGAMR
jgi:hypothetical protein